MDVTALSRGRSARRRTAVLFLVAVLLTPGLVSAVPEYRTVWYYNFYSGHYIPEIMPICEDHADLTRANPNYPRVRNVRAEPALRPDVDRCFHDALRGWDKRWELIGIAPQFDFRYWNSVSPNAGKPGSCPVVNSAVGVTDPINAGTGNNYQHEPDYQGEGPMPLHIERHYNSQYDGRTKLGPSWRPSYSRSLLPVSSFDAVSGEPVELGVVMARRDDGRSLGFRYDPATDGFVPDYPSITERLVRTATGFQLITPDEQVEDYDAEGRLQQIRNRAGLTQTMQYDDEGRLNTVTGPFGGVLTYVYDDWDRLAVVRDPAGGEYRYGHDANSNLVAVTYPDGTTRRYVYDDAVYPHALTGIIDETGTRFATWTYDAQGRAASSEHAGGQERVTLQYHDDDSTTVTDANGHVQRYRYTRQYGVIRTTAIEGEPCGSCEGLARATTLDSNGFVSGRTDFNGNVTTYVRDARGLELSRTEAAGTAQARTISTEWHAAHRVPLRVLRRSVAEGQTAATVYAYDDPMHPKLPTSIARSGYAPDGSAVTPRTVFIIYTADGQIRQVDGPRDNVSDITTLDYYPNDAAQGHNRGRLREVSNALGHTVYYEAYDAHGRVTRMRDANGVVTTYAYDARQRLVGMTVQPPQGAARQTTYGYDPVGQLVQTRLPDGRVLTYSYDRARLLRGVTDNLGNQVGYDYDAKGNRIAEAVRDPDGALVRQVASTYDARDRLTQINAAGSLSQWGYDDNGNATTVTDPNGNLTQHAFDALDRLSATLDALAGITAYDYDVNDRVTEVIAPNDASTRFAYDDLGNLLGEDSADRGVRNYRYDTAGNRIEVTDGRGVTATYNYDALGRVTAVDYPGVDEDVAFIYDTCTLGIGRLCTMNDQSGETAYRYDAFGNVVEQVRTELGVAYTTRYAYDAGDHMTATTYPGGRIANYARNPVRQIQAIDTTVNGAVQTVVGDVFYRADGQLRTRFFGNGLAELRDYDLQGRLTAQTLTADAEPPVAQSVTLSASPAGPQVRGTPVTFTATATGTAHGYQYRFYQQGPATGGAPVLVADYSAQPSWTWASGDADIGANTVTVEVRAAGSNSAFEAAANLDYVIEPPPVSDVTLSVDRASPQPAGADVAVTAQAQGGSGQYEYRFLLNGPATGGVDTVVQDYSAAGTWTWDSDIAYQGDNTVTVEARNAGAAAVQAQASAVYQLTNPGRAYVETFSADRPSPQNVGATITFTAQAYRGSGKYEYRYYAYGAATGWSYQPLTAWSASGNFEWTPGADMAGTVYVYVRVRNRGTAGDGYDSSYWLLYTIEIPRSSAVTLSADRSSPQTAGTPITFTAQGQGDGITDFEYQYMLHGVETNWQYVVVRDWSTDNSWIWNPTEADSVGNAYVYVRVRNALSNGNYEAQDYKYYTIVSGIEPATGVSLTVDKPSPQPTNAPVTFTAQGQGGNVGAYEYQYLMLGPETGNQIVIVRDWNSVNTWTWNPTEADSIGNTYIYARVRNAGSTGGYEAQSYIYYTITAASAS